LIISGPRMRTTSISPPNSDRWAQSDNFDPIRLSGLWAPAPRKLTNTQAAMKYIKLFDQSIWPIGDINLEAVTVEVHKANLDQWRHKKRFGDRPCDGSLYQLGLIISGSRVCTQIYCSVSSNKLETIMRWQFISAGLDY
jgi:hypothetical protein